MDYAINEIMRNKGMALVVVLLVGGMLLAMAVSGMTVLAFSLRHNIAGSHLGQQAQYAAESGVAWQQATWAQAADLLQRTVAPNAQQGWPGLWLEVGNDPNQTLGRWVSGFCGLPELSMQDLEVLPASQRGLQAADLNQGFICRQVGPVRYTLLSHSQAIPLERYAQLDRSSQVYDLAQAEKFWQERLGLAATAGVQAPVGSAQLHYRVQGGQPQGGVRWVGRALAFVWRPSAISSTGELHQNESAVAQRTLKADLAALEMRLLPQASSSRWQAQLCRYRVVGGDCEAAP